MEINKMQIEKKILKIEKDLNINALGMSKLMGITINTYRKKKSEKELKHSFNEDNYNKLVFSLKNYIKKI